MLRVGFHVETFPLEFGAQAAYEETNPYKTES